MAQVTITIKRGDFSRHTCSEDCELFDRYSQPTGCDDEEHIGQLVAESLNACFGGMNDLFSAIDVLMLALYYSEPTAYEVGDPVGTAGTLKTIANAWKSWEDEEGPFEKHLLREIRKNKNNKEQ